MRQPIRGDYRLTVTSFHPSPVGGGILIGTDSRKGKSRRARIAFQVSTRPPRIGELWRVSGTWVEDERHGWQLDTERAMPVTLTGDAIVRWISSSDDLPGIGKATAARVWAELGPDLYRALREGDTSVIAPVLGAPAASILVAKFRLLVDEIDVFEWFDRHGQDPQIAVAAVSLWGRGAIIRIEQDPYCLTLLEPWRQVDERAIQLGLAEDDERRLISAVNEAIARRYRGHDRGVGGHMAATKSQIILAVRQLLGWTSGDLAQRAVTLAVETGELINHGNLWQGRAAHLMEREIEHAISDRLQGASATVEYLDAITSVEKELSVQFEATQVEAVGLATRSRFAVIDGAAGTGKSMVTRAILRAVQSADQSFIQVALSGRAAKRLREATGHDAFTIHRFLKGLANGTIRLSPGKVLIDEASMVATPDLWQILSWALPSTDLILIGDPGQLPPINAGNPLAAMVESPSVPRVTLTKIHRQSGQSPIPLVAAAIRNGQLPALPEFDPERPEAEGVFLASTEACQVPARTLQIFENFVGAPTNVANRTAIRQIHAARTQILGSTVFGPAGVRTISDSVEALWMAHQPQITGWGLAEGSKIIWNRNSYGHDTGIADERGNTIFADIMNGSLGIIQRAMTDGALVVFDDEISTRALIRQRDLDRVSRGWAITVHKAQGSSFDTIVLPVVRSRLLDRQLLYTAITRAKFRVVIVGEPTVLEMAIRSIPRGLARQQCLLKA